MNCNVSGKFKETGYFKCGSLEKLWTILPVAGFWVNSVYWIRVQINTCSATDINCNFSTELHIEIFTPFL